MNEAKEGQAAAVAQLFEELKESAATIMVASVPNEEDKDMNRVLQLKYEKLLATKNELVSLSPNALFVNPDIFRKIQELMAGLDVVLKNLASALGIPTMPVNLSPLQMTDEKIAKCVSEGMKSFGPKDFDMSSPHATLALWSRFQEICERRFSNTLVCILLPFLKEVLSFRSDSAGWFKDVVGPYFAKELPNLVKLKTLYMEYFIGPNWKATFNNRIHMIGFSALETTRDFANRLYKVAAENDIDLGTESPALLMLKKELYVKLPDQVKQKIGKEEKDFKTCRSLLEAATSFEGNPANIERFTMHCPYCPCQVQWTCSCDASNSELYASSGRLMLPKKRPRPPGTSFEKPKDPPKPKLSCPSHPESNNHTAEHCHYPLPQYAHLSKVKAKEDRKEKRRDHLSNNCRYCDLPWVPGHKAVCSKWPKYRSIISIDKCLESHLQDIEDVSTWFVDEEDQAVSFPLVINGVRSVASVDTGATLSLIKPQFAQKLQLALLKHSSPLTLKLGVNSSQVNREGYVRCYIETPNYKTEATLEVLDHSFRTPIVIGVDLLGKLGMGIYGLPCQFPNPDTSAEKQKRGPNAANAEAQDDSVEKSDPSSKGEPEILDLDYNATVEELMKINKKDPKYPSLHFTFQNHLKLALKKELDVNQSLKGFCNHPLAMIRIDTGSAQPVSRRQYPIPYKLRDIIRAQVSKWLETGITAIVEGTSDYNNPLLAVPKRDLAGVQTDWRTCIDPRLLNNTIKPDSFPLPLIAELLELLDGAMIFSKIDLKQGFNQFQIHPDDRLKTTFTWDGVQYYFIGAPFGLKNLPAKFQRCMSSILRGLPYVIVYMDDVIVFSKAIKDHLAHVQNVLAVLTEVNLRVNLDKCDFGCDELIILGHHISQNGISVAKEKLLAMERWARPTTGKQVQRHLGFFNYFRDHIPMYSKLTEPLEKLRYASIIAWNDELQKVYDQIKSILSSNTILAFPQFDKPFLVGTDASNRGLGAVLYQHYNNKDHFIKFAARSLRQGEKGYGATKRELAAIIFALESFRMYTGGQNFTLYTDHKALTFLFTQKKPNQMLENWMEILTDFQFEIIHRPGILNVLPDAISRFYDDDPIENTDFQPMFSKIDIVLPNLPEELRVIVGKEEQETLLDLSHAQGHFGAKAMVKLIHKQYQATWPNLLHDCQTVVNRCLSCQRYNIGRHGYHPLSPLNALLPWDHLCIDLKDMPRSQNGFEAFLIVVDVFTRFVFVRPLVNKTAGVVAQTLFKLFCDVGFPKILQSDNGPEFIAGILKEVVQISKIDHRFISAYHHRGNGLAERHIRTISDSILKELEGRLDLWDLYIPAVQLYANLKISEVTGSAPFTLMYARPFVGFIDHTQFSPSEITDKTVADRLEFVTSVVYPAIQEHSHRFKTKYVSKFNSTHRIINEPIPVGSLVMVRDELRADKTSPRYEGPFRVVRVSKGGSYLLESKDGAVYRRPPNVLKLVDPLMPMQTENAVEVERIIADQDEDGVKYFLVKWKDRDESYNEWLKTEDFYDQGPIQAYLKAKYPKRRAHKQVTKKTRKR